MNAWKMDDRPELVETMKAALGYLLVTAWMGAFLYSFYLDHEFRHWIGFSKLDYLGEDAGVHRARTVTMGMENLLAFTVLIYPNLHIRLKRYVILLSILFR